MPRMLVYSNHVSLKFWEAKVHSHLLRNTCFADMVPLVLAAQREIQAQWVPSGGSLFPWNCKSLYSSIVGQQSGDGLDGVRSAWLTVPLAAVCSRVERAR